MRSSYSSLDWVMSHWAHFTVHGFICVYACVFCVFLFHTAYVLCYCERMVGWTWWDWSLILWTYLPSVLWHCWLGYLTRKNPSPIWPIMCLVGRETLLCLSINHWRNLNLNLPHLGHIVVILDYSCWAYCYEINGVGARQNHLQEQLE